jgi:Cu(I)/Ag(I) efflux system membrane protein CusA/SilA
LVIHRLIEFSLRNRFLVIAFYVAIAAWSYWALLRSPVDAIPDLSDNQVIVFTDWTGRSPQEVEDQVTYPLSVSLQGLPGVRTVRSSSAFGFSMIFVIFDDNVDLYFARTRVLERLNLVTKQMPPGVTPTLGPDATGVGHIFWYTVEGPGYSLRDLRTLQDWFIRYQITSVAGVAEVASVGGEVQQYQIDVDPDRLRTYGLPLSRVVDAVMRSNQNVGGNVIEANGAWSLVRGLGLIQTVADIENIPVGAKGGVPVYVRDVANVNIGNAFRVASLVKGTQEAVGGVVVARFGTNPREVIDRVKSKIADLQVGLPPGVRIVPFYDRSQLIDASVDTLRVALLEEILLLTVSHIIFLAHFRSILIVSLPLPLAVLSSFLILYYLGVTSNIMSLAGIAIAIGELVDAGIVVTENAFRYVERSGIDTRDRRALLETVLASTKLVGRPIFFAMAIIVLAFVSVFALTGQEGKLFYPLALAKTAAMIGATVISVTLVPVLCTFLLRGRMRREQENPVLRLLQWMYQPVLRWVLGHRAVTLAAAIALFGGALYLATRIGSEFMPPLNEGDLMFMPIADPSISLAENTAIAARQNAIIEKFPEVAFVVAKVARADTATDPSALNMTETVVHLEPREKWRPGMTVDRLKSELDRAVAIPGVANIWTMPIINRIDMLSTGIRSQLGIKVFGSDLKTLEQKVREIAEVVRQLPGARDVYAEQVTGALYTDVDIDRQAAARFGIGVGEVQDVIETAIGEKNLNTTIEGRKRFPVRVRYAPQFRKDLRSLGSVLVATPEGGQIPLGRVASIKPVSGPAMINSENGLLVVSVLLNVRDRDVGGFVDEAKRVIPQRVSLPEGYYLGWSGQYENQARARQRLLIVFPVVLVIIYTLLFLTYRSFLEAAHVLTAVPFALTGGIYLLYLLGYNFSVAVWVGFITLLSTAVGTSMVMVVYLEEAVARKKQDRGEAFGAVDLREAVMEGALLRLRPKFMTVATTVAGMIPIMWSQSVGAEVIKPLATPVLGGMVSSLLLVLIVTPVMFLWLKERELRKKTSQGGNE